MADTPALCAREEYLLVDPGTGRTADAADEVRGYADALDAPAPDSAVTADLFATRLEAGTGRCAGLDELSERLIHNRMRLATAARAAGTWIVPSATAAMGGPAAPRAKFGPVADTYAAAVAEVTCGCHLQLAAPDPETAVAVVNHLRPWLPTLLALSANSPYQDGADTGYASWRHAQRSRLPAGGMPPHFASVRAYEARVSRLVEMGVLVAETAPHWLAHPVPRRSEVELHVADTGVDVESTVLQAALSKALVQTALADLAAGREAPAIGEQVAAAALWSAARHGMSGPGIHPVLERTAPATVLVSELLAAVRPALEDNGDLITASSGVRRLLRLGTGAARQRAAGNPYEATAKLAANVLPA
ncbi:carboxylate-amine ligase [Actinophytocola oryzae]|uniref:Putative glutamate--cysteine ligase 2 n=1 Tax=Actinophytocola oryzae TaxID=502181 RepID=A0A4R7V4A3_9PSEU|nr:glutamate-cysteine ligase family protein [Actinophytocola oryzae]TDV43574.1 carboxylate-amine ligase [Actinophytocola oryzae]